MGPMTTTTTLTVADLLRLVPGARLVDGFEVPDNIDEPYPLPYGDNPPGVWFVEPHPDVEPGATGIITADGQFSAYCFEWSRCHNGFTADGTCWTPPRSPTENRYFHQAAVITAEGVQIDVGVIPLGEGHAANTATYREAIRWYGRPLRTRVRARVVENDVGGVMCGSIVPGTTYREVAVMRASALSGDWRYVPELGTMDFLGPCFVARPGLPIGLEVAALQSLWNVARSFDVQTAAAGQPRAVTGRIEIWAPRPPVTDNVPQPVLAAATIGEPMHTQTLPGQTTPAAPACSCQTTPAPSAPAVQSMPAPVVRSRQAAAGTPLTFRDLDEAVRLAVQQALGHKEGRDVGAPGRWVWVRDWDDAWAIAEIEENGENRDVQVTIAIQPDGQVLVDATSAVEVDTVYVPVAPVMAHASSDTAIAALRTDMAALVETVDGLASDVARMLADDLEPADLDAALPEAPETE